MDVGGVTGAFDAERPERGSYAVMLDAEGEPVRMAHLGDFDRSAGAWALVRDALAVALAERAQIAHESR